MSKQNLIYSLFVAVCSLVLSGCKDTYGDTGLDMLTDGQLGVVNTIQVPLNSHTIARGAIVSRPDSLLLGCLSSAYGTVQADFITQLAIPEGFEFPEGATLDSVMLFLSYASYVGDGASTLSMNAYSFDKGVTLSTYLPYYTNIDISRYTSASSEASILSAPRTFTPIGSKGIISARVKDDMAQRIFEGEIINGLYVTTEFGSSVVMNIREVQMTIFYTFTYLEGGTTPRVEHAYKSLYGNSEVRQVNHVTWTNLPKDESKDNIIGPSGLCTEIAIPLRQFCKQIYDSVTVHTQDLDTITLRPYINRAYVRVDVVNDAVLNDPDDHNIAPASQMLLLSSAEVASFFDEHAALSDTMAILSAIRSEADKTGDYYSYYYSYDLSKVLIYALRRFKDDPFSVADTMRMTLVPVEVETSTSSQSTIVAIDPAQTLTATVVNISPMETLFSGF